MQPHSMTELVHDHWRKVAVRALSYLFSMKNRIIGPNVLVLVLMIPILTILSGRIFNDNLCAIHVAFCIGKCAYYSHARWPRTTTKFTIFYIDDDRPPVSVQVRRTFALFAFAEEQVWLRRKHGVVPCIDGKANTFRNNNPRIVGLWNGIAGRYGCRNDSAGVAR